MAGDPSASSTAHLCILPLGEASTCWYAAHAIPTHSDETQITTFAGTSSPPFEIL